MRLIRISFLVVILFAMAAGVVVLAQGGDVAPFSLDWRYVMALFINSVLVVVAVEIVKSFAPQLPGGIKQVLALVAGPVLMWASTAISSALGYAIDFGPLIEVFSGLVTGLAGMGLFDVAKKAVKG
ncbi:MAG: hypothetical protein GTO41_13230 [Burkholderiales bacterium]|nr:hypothetical protein [Burkholderiales bacterium]